MLEIDEMETVFGTLNTITASKWEMFLSKLFGKRHETKSVDGYVVAYTWRGKIYITEIEEVKL